MAELEEEEVSLTDDLKQLRAKLAEVHPLSALQLLTIVQVAPQRVNRIPNPPKMYLPSTLAHALPTVVGP